MARLYSGPYSTVYKRGDLAVKVIDKDFSVPPHDYHKELKFLKDFNHKNIVRLVKQEDKFDEVLLYMECYTQTLSELLLANCIKKTKFRPDGELLFVKDNKLPFESLIRIISEIIDGIQYIHLKGVIHRDIKPSNVLIRGEEVVICDFGILVENELNDYITDVCSGYYKPLELIFALKYSYEIDIWCLGILISALMSNDGSNILYDNEDDMNRETISDFLLIERIFLVFGTPSNDSKSINYWPLIFHVQNFSLINLAPRDRRPLHKIFPKCTNPQLLDLFNNICDLNNERRIGINSIKSKFNEILKD